jgi:hypothetical protein
MEWNIGTCTKLGDFTQQLRTICEAGFLHKVCHFDEGEITLEIL